MSAAQTRLIVHRPAPPSFEDALGDAVRNAPYLGTALLVHALLLLLLWSLKTPVVVPDVGRTLRASPVDEALPELPPPPPEPVTLEEPPPVLSEDPAPTTEPPTDLPADTPSESPADDPAPDAGALAVAGLGPRGPTRFGPPGPAGGRRTPAGTPTDTAVLAALEWLKYHQAEDGHWSGADFDERCGALGTDVVCDGRGSPRFDVGLTGLSLLAFLGAGSTDQSGAYARTVRDGLHWLVEVQDGDGLLVPTTATQGTYDQALGALALCDAYARGRSARLRRPAERALDALVALRSPGSGWRYMPDHPEMADPTRRADGSVTGWALLALLTGRKAGLTVDEHALADGLAFLDEMTDPATGRTGYVRRGSGVSRAAGLAARWPADQSEALTAVAVLCRVFADPGLSHPGWEQAVDRGAALVAALPPVWSDEQPGRRDFYFWYYGAYALYQVGGPPWERWQRAIVEELMPHQHQEGERRGSWDPQGDPWGDVGGRVYATAINALTLEVFYRYPSLTAGHR